jgi:predicted transcriptional regulator YdeE
MVRTEVKSFRLIGLSLIKKTSNEKGQSNIDCGNLWQEFISRNLKEKIPGRLGEEIYAVYHQYEGDHTKPFSYFIGCRVRPGTTAPAGLNSITICDGIYQIFTAKGKMPECIAQAWNTIWNADIHRAYHTDFEIYGDKSADWNKAEIEIFVSINK